MVGKNETLDGRYEKKENKKIYITALWQSIMKKSQMSKVLRAVSLNSS